MSVWDCTANYEFARIGSTPILVTMIKYTKELLVNAVAQSKSLADLMKVLNCDNTPGKRGHIAKRLIAYQIDFSHFSRSERVYGTNKKHPRKARQVLENANIEEKCLLCSCPNFWQGKPLKIQVDHISRMYHVHDTTIINLCNFYKIPRH